MFGKIIYETIFNITLHSYPLQLWSSIGTVVPSGEVSKITYVESNKHKKLYLNEQKM